jgi:hypothetical protein
MRTNAAETEKPYAREFLNILYRKKPTPVLLLVLDTKSPCSGTRRPNGLTPTSLGPEVVLLQARHRS